MKNVGDESSIELAHARFASNRECRSMSSTDPYHRESQRHSSHCSGTDIPWLWPHLHPEVRRGSGSVAFRRTLRTSAPNRVGLACDLFLRPQTGLSQGPWVASTTCTVRVRTNSLHVSHRMNASNTVSSASPTEGAKVIR